jgi:hypothetical protein
MFADLAFLVLIVACFLVTGWLVRFCDQSLKGEGR